MIDLARSISEQGILQPLVVTPVDGTSQYRLVAGERRYRAARLLGLGEVPVVVRRVDEPDAFELALIENIQREDLNPLEEAEAYRRLIDEHSYTQEALARRVGKERPTISNSLRLLKLSDQLREKLLRGGITAGHARALLGTDDEEYREQLALRIEDEGLSVRTVERLVRQEARGKKPEKPIEGQSPTMLRMCDRLQDRLGRQIRIKPKRQGEGGTVVIAFTNESDLQRLVARLSRR